MGPTTLKLLWITATAENETYIFSLLFWNYCGVCRCFYLLESERVKVKQTRKAYIKRVLCGHTNAPCRWLLICWRCKMQWILTPKLQSTAGLQVTPPSTAPPQMARHRNTRQTDAVCGIFLNVVKMPKAIHSYKDKALCPCSLSMFKLSCLSHQALKSCLADWS